MLHLAEFVPEFIDSLPDAEEKLGAEIVRKALVCPARLIASNAGYEGDVIIESLKNTSFETGYNAVSPPFSDWVTGLVPIPLHSPFLTSA